MEKEQPNTPLMAIPLAKNKRIAVTIGCALVLMAVFMSRFALGVVMAPILTAMDKMDYYALIMVIGTIGMVVMTPIGGKAGDMFGRITLIVLSSAIAIAASVGIAFAKTVIPFAVFRLLLGFAQGAFLAAPYIIIGEIYEQKNVPKLFGIMAACTVIAGLLGSMSGGVLADKGLISYAILLPAIPAAIGALLIGLFLPNKTKENRGAVDFAGIIALTATISALIFATNFGGKWGWTNIYILAAFAATIICLFALSKIEKKAKEPIFPPHLFANKALVTLFIISFTAMYYLTSITYITLTAQKVLVVSNTVAGSLQLPRTVIAILLPVFIGVWVAKKKENYWKSIAIALAILLVSFAAISFTTPATPVAFLFIAVAFTGIAESFRSVSITPAAQAIVPIKDIGASTALMTFAGILAQTISATGASVAIDAFPNSLNSGLNCVFIITAVISLIGLLLAVCALRKFLSALS